MLGGAAVSALAADLHYSTCGIRQVRTVRSMAAKNYAVDCSRQQTRSSLPALDTPEDRRCAFAIVTSDSAQGDGSH
jgi:hypothetical protein